VIAEDEEHLEARLRLANVLEEQGHKAEALDIVTEGMSRSRVPPFRQERYGRSGDHTTPFRLLPLLSTLSCLLKFYLINVHVRLLGSAIPLALARSAIE
jgi:hypothetical protein